MSLVFTVDSTLYVVFIQRLSYIVWSRKQGVVNRVDRPGKAQAK